MFLIFFLTQQFITTKRNLSASSTFSSTFLFPFLFRTLISKSLCFFHTQFQYFNVVTWREFSLFDFTRFSFIFNMIDFWFSPENVWHVSNVFRRRFWHNLVYITLTHFLWFLLTSFVLLVFSTKMAAFHKPWRSTTRHLDWL